MGPKYTFVLLFSVLVFCLVSARGVCAENNIPGSLVNISKGQRVLLVEKATHTLYVYGADYNVIETFNITTGKNHGDKQIRGDLKTPEGVYFFEDVIDGRELPSKYGAMAATTDYPNPLDLLKKKTGSGIWLHATDDPSRLERPFDTRGCVVIVNEDIFRVASHIELMSTPIVIVDRLDYRSRDEVMALGEDVLEFLQGGGLIDALTDKDTGVSLIDRDIDILMHGTSVVASSVEGGTRRRFYLAREEEGWKVIGEKRYGVPEKNMENFLKNVVLKTAYRAN